jgi:O-antigen ligase
MKVLKLTIVALVLLNTPSIVLTNFGPTLGSLLSYTTILLLVIYYVLTPKRTALNIWMIVLALSYFVISSFQYIGDTKYFIVETIKYFVVVICGYELLKKVNIVEIYFIFLIGTLSIGLEAVFFPSKWGRYAGFYINPNVAGFICIYAYSLTYGLKKESLKLLGQFIFTLMGLLTFSRTFIVIWVCLNIISLKISIKNIRILGLGFLIISSLFFIDELVGLNNPRFDSMKKILNNEQVTSSEINDDSRTDTWAKFYDEILAKPIFGNGYGTFSGLKRQGVHNSYLMLIGEAGIIPIIILLSMLAYMFYWGFILFKYAPNLLMQVIALSLFLLANHNFFVFYYIIFTTMWIQTQIIKYKDILYQNQLQIKS